jgi:hypothetical protein
MPVVNRLADAEKVPFAVPEPRALLSDALARIVPCDRGDAVHGPYPGDVVFLEDDPSRAQSRECCLDVSDLKCDLGVRARGGAGRLIQRERTPAAPIEKAARPLFDGLQPELLRIERPCPLQILSRQPGRDGSVVEHLPLRDLTDQA